MDENELKEIEARLEYTKIDYTRSVMAELREIIQSLLAEVRRLTTGADIKVHCPHCKQLSLTVVTGGRLIKNEPEGELK